VPPPPLTYTPPPAGPDEVGPAWRPLFAAAAALGPAELARRWHDARHLLRGNGVTYTVYNDPTGADRAWKLDPWPMVVPDATAGLLDRGLTQRTRLLELVLADLYGPQTLLADRLLPPELVYANPGFLRPCHGLVPPGGRFLYLAGCNLGRDEGGTWRVLGDRTQAPSGAGYALENRIVTARTLPEAFADCRVQRLAHFFRGVRDALAAGAPAGVADPRIVLLTPGPLNETYFEHAYLARYLNFTLAEGGDLTVRDDRVYLKVLGGLQPVDVIFRRLDDDFCDPLELMPTSYLGVPGLVNAVRAGTVTVANALGTGVLETPALLGCLPRLCRHLLGEDLVLEGVRSWWCGEPGSLAYVLDHLEGVVIKPLFLAARLEPVVVGELPAAERAVWVDRLTHRPGDFVAQERLPLSTTPVFVDGELVPRKCVLRAYVGATAGGGFTVMPGGLTRVSGSPHAAVVTMQGGGGSKDTWFVASGEVAHDSLLSPPNWPVALTRDGGDLPSRAADNLYWLGRYAERAEDTARLVRGILVRLTERAGPADGPGVAALLGALARHCGPAGAADATVRAALFAPDGPGSLVTVLGRMHQVAAAVRDRISLDMWRAVADAHRLPGLATARAGPAGPTPSDLLELANRTVLALAAFAGLAAEGMTRSEGWRFLDIGRRVERSLHLLGLLAGPLTDAPDATGTDGPVLEAVLEVADSGMTYHRRYLGGVRADAVLDLVVLDETNPRSLASQLVALADHIDHLPRPREGTARDVLDRVRGATAGDLAAVTPAGRPGLRQLGVDLGAALPALSDLITQNYLTLRLPSRHMASGAGG